MSTKKLVVFLEPGAASEQVRTRLTAEGYDLAWAFSEEEARALLTGPFDAALLDCDALSDGAVCEEIVRTRSPERKILVALGERSGRELTRLMRLGAFDLVLKPIDLDDVSTSVARVFACIDQEILELKNRAEMTRWTRHLAIINEIGRRGSSIQDTKDLMVMAATQVHSRFGFYHVYIGLIEEKSQSWSVVGQAGGYGNLVPAGFKMTLKEGITGKVARTGQPVMLNNVTGDPDYKPMIRDTLAELCLPIKIDGATTGLINIESREPDVFNETDLALLETLADQIGSALKGIRLFERMKETKEYLETLIAASCDAIVTTDPRGRITFFSLGAESIYGYRNQDVVGTLVGDLYREGRPEAERIMRILLTGERAKNIETVVFTKDRREVYVDLSASLLRDKNGHIIGTLGVSKDITERVVLENRLKELTITDSLTGLYNQRHFYVRLEVEVERARRQRRELALMLFDLDKFKFHNDTYGHQEGDRILKVVGQLIDGSIRKNVDAGFRYGGDEFVIILPELAPDLLPNVCYRIKTAIEKGLAKEITLSTGVVRFIDHYTLESFVKKADEAMYRSKRSGRNEIEYA